MEPSPTFREPVQPAPVVLNPEKFPPVMVVIPFVQSSEEHRKYADICSIEALMRNEAPIDTYRQRELAIGMVNPDKLNTKLVRAWLVNAAKLAVYLDHGITRDMEECVQLAFLHSKELAFRWVLEGGNKLEKMMKQGMELHVSRNCPTVVYGLAWRPGTFTKLPIWLVHSNLNPTAEVWAAELEKSIMNLREAGLIYPVHHVTYGSELFRGGDGHVYIYKWHTFKD